MPANTNVKTPPVLKQQHKAAAKQTHQLQSALAKYLFASSLCRVLLQSSPAVALPPLNTVPFRALTSAFGPVVVAFPLPITSCRGKLDSGTSSWPDGMRSNVLWFEAGVGSGPLVTFDGSALRASRTMCWCGGQAFGASLSTCYYSRSNVGKKSYIHTIAAHFRGTSQGMCRCTC
jgi:hypothetical protein